MRIVNLQEEWYGGILSDIRLLVECFSDGDVAAVSDLRMKAERTGM